MYKINPCNDQFISGLSSKNIYHDVMQLWQDSFSRLSLLELPKTTVENGKPSRKSLFSLNTKLTSLK